MQGRVMRGKYRFVGWVAAFFCKRKVVNEMQNHYPRAVRQGNGAVLSERVWLRVFVSKVHPESVTSTLRVH